MKKSNMLGMIAMMAMASDSFRHDLIEEEETKRNKPIKKIIPKGLKEFFYGQEVIYAMNQKVAEKKARKKGLII